MTTVREHMDRAFHPCRDVPELTEAEKRAAREATAQGNMPTPGALSAIDSSWYTRMIGLPDAARTRAQNAYTIASAVAAGLLGAALLVRLDTQPSWVKVVGVTGIGVWAVACLFYVWTVASPIFVSFPDIDDDNAFVAAVANATRIERNQVDSRVWVANKVSLVAIVLTTTAVAGAVLHGPVVRPASISLNSVEAGVVSAACGRKSEVVQGMVEVSTLSGGLVVVHPRSCLGTKKLIIPSSTITAIVMS